MKVLKEIVNDHIKYRKQIFKLAKANLVKTYRGAALGWMWAIIKPAVTIFVYWFAFTVGIRANGKVNGYPYFLWLLSSLVPWFYMGEMIVEGANCIRRYKYLVTKMKFPVSTIPTFVSLSKITINIALIVIVVILFAIFGYYPDIYLLQVPFYLLLSFIFFTSWSLFASFLGAISKDFLNLVKSFVTVVFWLSAILWNADNVKVEWLRKFLNLNPITFLINGYRNCFINKVWFWQQPKRLMYFCILTLILITLALWSYKKLRKEIADVL